MPATTADLWTEADLRLLYLLLSPEYVVPAARERGAGDPVLGAAGAAAEIRAMLRRHVRGVLLRHRRRLRADRELRAAVLADLDAVQTVARLAAGVGESELYPLPSTWREVACASWPHGAETVGHFEVEVGAARPSAVNLAAVVAISRVLVSEPEFGRAVLDRRVWGRYGPQVMVTVEIAPDEVRGVVLDARAMGLRDVRAAIVRWVRAYRRLDEHPLSRFAHDLWVAWSRHGLLWSPAGAIVAPVAAEGVSWGRANLAPNGVPLVVTVGEVTGGRVRLGVTTDHRAFDGSHAGRLRRALSRELEAVCSEASWSSGGVPASGTRSPRPRGETARAS